MKTILAIAAKDLRLLIRDPKATIILLVMPLAFIIVLGVSLGEDRIRVSIVNLDKGKWSKKVLEDLRQTAGIEVEDLDSPEQAKQLVRDSRRAAVFIFGPKFSEKVEECSFLAEGINPFSPEGVDLRELDARILRDDTQLMSASIIEQVAQGTLFRVTLPWMIVQAFAEIGKPRFVDRLSKREQVLFLSANTTGLAGTPMGCGPILTASSLGRFRTELNVDMPFDLLIEQMGKDDNFKKVSIGFLTVQAAFKTLPERQRKQLAEAMKESFTLAHVLRLFDDKQKKALAAELQDTLQDLLFKFDLKAPDWDGLIRSAPRASVADTSEQESQIIGRGFLRRGAIRYQKLVPSSIVMFAFFMVLTGGWLFVAERSQGTMKRLRAAPISRGEILLGKMLCCFAVSVLQGVALLLAGKLVFNMSWGSQPWWLIAVVLATSLAATGMALLIAALARTETQVAIYGTLLVLLLAGLSGALMGDRSMMPERMEQISRVTPHAWALDAYRQLLSPPGTLAAPGATNYWLVGQACLVLTAFGIGFTAISWWGLKLE